jgi:hypothetical protein
MRVVTDLRKIWHFCRGFDFCEILFFGAERNLNAPLFPASQMMTVMCTWYRMGKQVGLAAGSKRICPFM